MATGISQSRANASIDAAVAAGRWIKMHVGDPGAAGTANPATETTRKQATMAAASGGSAASSADLTWTAVAANEVWTHFSMWSASSGGTFLWSGTVTGGLVTAGGSWTAPVGGLVLSLSGAA